MSKKNYTALFLIICFIVGACSKQEETNLLPHESIELTKSPYEMASAFYGERDYENAITYYQLVLEDIKLGRTESGIKEFWIKGYIGRSYLELGEYEYAKPYIEEAKDGYLKLSETANGFSFVCQTEGRYYLKTKQYEDALLCFEQSLEYAESQDSDVVRTYIEMGAVYEYLNEKERVLDYYDRAIMLSEQLEDYGNLSNANAALGIFYANDGEREKAELCFSSGLEYAKMAWGEESFKTADAYRMLASNYNLKEEYGAAIKNLESALDIYQKLNGPYERENASIYSSMGYIYMELDDEDSALEMLQKSYNIVEMKGTEDKQISQFYENVLIKNINKLYKKTEIDNIEYEEWFAKNFEN